MRQKDSIHNRPTGEIRQIVIRQTARINLLQLFLFERIGNPNFYKICWSFSAEVEFKLLPLVRVDSSAVIFPLSLKDRPRETICISAHPVTYEQQFRGIILDYLDKSCIR